MNNQYPDIDFVNDKMMSLAQITAFTGLSDKWFYKQIQLGKFPKPIKMGTRSAWLEPEVKAWLYERIAASRA